MIESWLYTYNRTDKSMGRLTLNILLSFAQFEREVTGERIRDKFEATRQKGLWIFGKPPYGYTKNEHNILIPEEPFATNIKQIFSSYLELKSVDKLQNKLKELNINSRTGKPFARGHLYKILSNKVYIGKLQHKDKEYDGQHKAIIENDIFKKVQELLQDNAVIKKHSLYSKEGSLLMGLLFDDVGNKMSPSHSNKKGKKYRYYITYKNRGENNYDIRLINAIVQSFWFNNKCANGELTRKEKLNGNNNRFKNLRFLPPNIIEDIINGKNDPDITVKDLLKIAG